MSTAAPPIDPASDLALVARARAGDSMAFDTLVERHQGKVYGLALRLSGNPSDAEEILQDTFLQVYRNLHQFREEAKFSTWLYRVATNSALMHGRTRRRHRAEPLEGYLPRFDETGGFADGTAADFERAARADELLERKELAQRALEAVDQLSELYKTVFVLRDIEGLSTEETAEVLGVDPGAVRTRLHRARLMLRGYLGNLVGG